MPLSVPLTIPEPWQRRYRALRLLMYLAIALTTGIFALRVLFPIIEQRFDFRSPGSSKNTILLPRSPENTPRENGKIEQGGILIADTAVIGDFSLIRATASLEKDSAVPDMISFSIRRSYQSFLYPTGEPLQNFPEETVYLVGDTYYALRNGTLFPFVSVRAYLSRFPKEYARPADDSLLADYPVSETWLGFRVGSLISNASGVFIVTSETEARPVGSAEIFLGLGYDFQDVVPASEEELGVYKRGRIFLMGAAHPDGTILLDQDDQTYYLVDQGTKRVLLPGAYRDFLTSTAHPIIVSTKASSRSAECSLLPNIFGTSFSCSTTTTQFQEGFGNDFEIRLTSADTDIDINTLSVSFETAKNTENMLTLLSQIKQRLLARLGGA